MQIYLPIAEMSANIMTLIGMGGLVGFMSGMFGVGGGFLMTPLLIFIGVPPAGFPEPLTSRVRKGRALPDGSSHYEGRPGADMADYDFDEAEEKLVAKYGQGGKIKRSKDPSKR